jgi:GxxExxY protein
MDNEELDNIGRKIVHSALVIHRELGPGLLESVYEVSFACLMEHAGHHVVRQKPISFSYRGILFENAFIPDLIIDNAVVVEIKAREKQLRVFSRQVNTYLKILDYKLGYVINFGLPLMKDGVERIVNNF